jgi:hypothetical protein
MKNLSTEATIWFAFILIITATCFYLGVCGVATGNIDLSVFGFAIAGMLTIVNLYIVSDIRKELKK